VKGRWRWVARKSASIGLAGSDATWTRRNSGMNVQIMFLVLTKSPAMRLNSFDLILGRENGNPHY